MTKTKTFLPSVLILATLVLVAACTPAQKKTESYVGTSGAVMTLESDQQSCTRSCEGDFERCLGTQAAQTPVGRNGQMDGVLGAKADCNAAMKSCLAKCKGR